MWLSQHQTVFTELIQSTLVRLCTEHVPYEGHLELDGLLCISSDTSGARQIVVKIHKVIGSNNAQSENDRVTKFTPKTVADHFNMPSNVTLQVVDVPPVNGLNRAIATRNGNDISPALDMTPSKELLVSKTNDGRMLAWKQRAPQILKLLTKSELSPASRNQMLLPTDLSLSSTNGVKNNNAAPSAAKKELNEDKIEDLSLGTLHSGNRWRCKICHIHCMSFGELELHMRSEHVRFVCRLCLNSFTLSCNLRRHMKLHAGVRPHICSHCSATFSRSTDLKIHMKKHTDMRSERGKNEASSPGPDSSSNSLRSTTPTGKASILHECEICNKGFAIASHLADHRLTHGFLAVKEENTVGTDNAADVNTSIDGDGSVDMEEANMDQFSSDTDQTLDLRSTSTVVQSVPNNHENAMDFSVNLSVKIPTCVADLNNTSTMREFVPLLNLSDSSNNDHVESNGGLVNSSTSLVPMNMTVVNKTIPSRSKRKGMPVKRIEVSSDENEDVTTDDSGAIVHETFSASDDTPGQESTPSPGQTDVHSPAHCTAIEEEEPNGQPHGDVDSKVYNCQYTGGCNTTWYGFAAYERHYTTMHGGRYPCPVCPQSFTSRNNRRRHADGHAGSPGSSRHQCNACGKLFARADISKEHRLTHTRSYRLGACTKCGDTGGNKRSSLLLHLKRCLAYVDIDKDIDDIDCTPVV